MRQLSKDEAVFLAESLFWESLSMRERAEFQMEQDRLCMPFPVFHEAIEKTLNRPVYTHEFGLDREGLRRELMGEREAPSFDQILALLPADKTTVIRT